MKIIINIERLALDGLALDARERAALQAALEAELGRMVAERGISPALLAGGALPSLSGAAIEHSPDTGPAALGARIARSVYGSIGAPEPSAPSHPGD